VGSDEPTLPAPLQITVEDVILGSDPHQIDLVIIDPSIEGVHARIHHEAGSFLITDAGTVAGTWVNYNQVGPQGMYLEHADIIHLGIVGFRFKLSEPGQSRKIVVTPLEPNQ
jgi:predicted component of type VI protein secretion system